MNEIALAQNGNLLALLINSQSGSPLRAPYSFRSRHQNRIRIGAGGLFAVVNSVEEVYQHSYNTQLMSELCDTLYPRAISIKRLTDYHPHEEP